VSTDKEFKLPFYVKAAAILIGLLATLTILYIAQHIIVPLVFAIIFAIVLHPVVNFFVQKKVNRVVAIVITLILTFIVIAAFGALLFSQASRFSESWPVLVTKFTRILNLTISWAAGYFDINAQKIHEWVTTTTGELINISSAAIGHTLMTVGSGLMILFLVPVYIFMLLFYEPLLLEFIHRLFGNNNLSQVNEIVTQIKNVIQRYLIGLVFEFVIVATLNIVVLLALGIEYAVLIGIIGAVVNVIPYIGGFVAVALPMIVAFATKDTGWYAFYVMIFYIIIQFIDNHYIIPKIVASKVKINALFAIIVVLVGNALWGITGMFLSLPILAIVKIIFDHIEPLKSWGFLLGDTMPEFLKIKTILLGKNKK